jgi:hypothetical protein
MSGRTKTTVSNLALREIGTYRIDDYDEDSAEAEVIRDVWDDTVRSCLGRHEWRFAMKQVQLQKSPTPPSARYEYQYRLPSDYVRLSAVSDRDTMEPITDWDVVYTDNAPTPTVITNADACYIEYVALLEDPETWAPHFVDYFVAVLASKIASPLKSTVERSRLVDYAERSALPMARSADSTMQPPKRPPLGNWIKAMKMGG